MSDFESEQFDNKWCEYNNLNVIVDEKSDPLEFWRVREANFPILSAIAKKLFSIPITSVASEQVFSKSGEVINKKRCNLKPKTAEYLTILDQDF